MTICKHWSPNAAVPREIGKRQPSVKGPSLTQQELTSSCPNLVLRATSLALCLGSASKWTIWKLLYIIYHSKRQSSLSLRKTTSNHIFWWRLSWSNPEEGHRYCSFAYVFFTRKLQLQLSKRIGESRKQCQYFRTYCLWKVSFLSLKLSWLFPCSLSGLQLKY